MRSRFGVLPAIAAQAIRFSYALPKLEGIDLQLFALARERWLHPHCLGSPTAAPALR